MIRPGNLLVKALMMKREAPRVQEVKFERVISLILRKLCDLYGL